MLTTGHRIAMTCCTYTEDKEDRMILPSVNDELLIARNRFWEQERREQRRYNICTDDMAYRGTECVCGQHEEEDSE